MDTTELDEAYRDLLDAADAVATANNAVTPPPGEWNADQILAHVLLVNAATITAASTLPSGVVATYDNRLAQDTWTIDRVITITGGTQELRNRIRLQGTALSAIVAGLSKTELDIAVPAILLSNGALLVDAQVPMRGLIDGLAGTELPGHATQLRALLPA
jgi:DinB superfamily